jgi:hypothetical protein
MEKMGTIVGVYPIITRRHTQGEEIWEVSAYLLG